MAYWTKWQDRFSVTRGLRSASAKRSIPVSSSACRKSQLARSQNLWEETFVRLCADRSQAAEVCGHLAAVIVVFIVWRGSNIYLSWNSSLSSGCSGM